jgi:hypothetical protein
MDFFLRDGDEQRALGATHLDDIDLIFSEREVGPWGRSLVAVAVKHGQHVCWQCGGPFDPQKSPLRAVEIKVQGASVPILLHAGCTGTRPKSFRSFTDIVRGLQARRFYAKAIQPLERVRAASGSEKP